MQDIDVIPRFEDEAFDRARAELQQAKRIVALLGAGISAESGVPTFRGPEGAYSSPEVRKWVDARTLESDHPEMMQWYQKRRDELHRVWPNEAHYSLARLGRHRDLVIATQNVDGLMGQASQHEGLYDLEIFRLHGSLDEVQCMKCKRVFSAKSMNLTTAGPCPQCGGPLRPAVTLFGEELRWDLLQQVAEEVMGADVCLVVGTSGLVHPVAELPSLARQAGAKLIEINIEDTAITNQMDFAIRGPAAEVLPALLQGWS